MVVRTVHYLTLRLAGMSVGQRCVRQSGQGAAAAAPAARWGIVERTLDLNSAVGAPGSALAVGDMNTMHFGYFVGTGHREDAERIPE